jgi:hypothetical protein
MSAPLRYLALALALPVISGGAALAHGTIPTANAIQFMPDGTLLLGTNFGAIHRASSDTFICETSVTGTQQALDLWRVLPDGSVAAAVIGADFFRGVFHSDAAGCAFNLVPGTEDLAVVSLTVLGSDLLVAGTRPDACSDCPERGVVALVALSGASPTVTELDTHGSPATGAVTDGDTRLAVFSAPGSATVVFFAASGEATRVEPALGEGVTLIPLGFGGGALYAIGRGLEGDEVLVSADLGTSFTSLGNVRGRIQGFAASTSRVWFQSPQLGVLTRDGDAVVELEQSPHGGCLAHRDGRLYACGVPWQDGFAVGVSDDDGATFQAVMPFFDGIAGARACEAELTATCDAELDFLREYYGFSEIVEPGPEISEVTEAPPELVEPSPETSPERERTRDEGCAGGHPTALIWALGLALFGLRRLSGRARTRGARG